MEMCKADPSPAKGMLSMTSRAAPGLVKLGDGTPPECLIAVWMLLQADVLQLHSELWHGRALSEALARAAVALPPLSHVPPAAGIKLQRTLNVQKVMCRPRRSTMERCCGLSVVVSSPNSSWACQNARCTLLSTPRSQSVMRCYRLLQRFSA